ncbi:MAG: hypothetical protein JRJ59_02710, partial [Deltaproteobacteria bacterium]|nr:hypothetical protein [Deltaproteobacteria bacterium]
MNRLKQRGRLLGSALALLFLCWGPALGQTWSQDLPPRLIDQRGLEFILVPAGRYAICGGPEPDEQPGRTMELKAFYLQATELTRGQWRTAGGDGRYHDSDPS